MPIAINTTSPRVGARVLLLDPDDRVLLIHARDPDEPSHHWRELPGGGLDDGEELADAARREVAEECGIAALELGHKLWIRESRFHYRSRDHHRVDHVFLGRTRITTLRIAPKPTENEKVGLIEHRWWALSDLHACHDKLLPRELVGLLDDLLSGRFGTTPMVLTDC